MKKILLFLAFFYNFAFANVYGSIVNGIYLNGGGVYCFKETAQVNQNINFSTSVMSAYAFYNNGYIKVAGSSYSCIQNSQAGYCQVEDVFSGVSVDASFCIPCDGTLQADGTCKPSIPTCATGSHYDTTVSACMSDFETLGKTTFDNGDFLVSWSDGASTFCSGSPSVCFTYDKGNNNRIANRYLNPEFNPDGTIKYDGAMPDEAPVKTTLDYILNPIGNAVGNTLQYMGLGIMVSATGGGALVYDKTVGLNALNPGVTLGAGLVMLGKTISTDDVFFTAVPTVSNDVEVKLVEKSASTTVNNLDNFQSDSAYTKQTVTSENVKTVWDSAGGVGKLPPNSLILGSDIIYPTSNPSKAIVNTPDKIMIVETNPDNSSKITEIAKQDLANTANNNTDLILVQKEISAPTIQNDGTVTQTQTTTPVSVNPLNNFPTSTNTKTGLPDYVDYDPKTGLYDGAIYSTATGKAVTTPTGVPLGDAVVKPNPDGTSTIDLTGVNTRLDKISNQLTKQNNSLDKIINTSNFSAETITHDIPTDYSTLDSWQETWNNLKSDFDNVASTADELTSLVNGSPLTLNFPKGSVTTCPTSSDIDFGYFMVSSGTDYCQLFSPFYPIFYLFTYVSLMLTTAFFAIKILFLIGV